MLPHAVFALLLCSADSVPGAGASLYVDCSGGSDAGDGSAARPFLTLTRARDALRALQPLAAPARVTVVSGDCVPRDGSGAVDFSLPVLALEPQDSGSAAAPITYAAGGGAPRLLSGAAVPLAAWRNASQPGVFVADLGPAGLDVARYGFGGPDASGCGGGAMELFCGGVPATVARYPNVAANGDPQWINILAVENAATSFTTRDTRVLGWANESRAWLHGYWAFDCEPWCLCPPPPYRGRAATPPPPFSGAHPPHPFPTALSPRGGLVRASGSNRARCGRRAHHREREHAASVRVQGPRSLLRHKLALRARR